jgi:hypothetical protein
MTDKLQHVYVVNPTAGGGGGGTVDQGAPGPCTDPWPVTIVDPTGEGTVCVNPGDDANRAMRVNVVAGLPVRGAITNKSGTITLGGTSQLLAAGNTTRSYFFVQNISSDVLWIDFDVAAVQDQPSIKLLPAATFVMESGFVSTDSITIIGPTTGAKFVAKEG